MWKGSVALLVWLVAFCFSGMVEETHAAKAYVYSRNGEYWCSYPASTNRPDGRLQHAEGKALLERILDPAHMVVTGLGEAGNATLRIGDDTRAALFAVLGPAKRLPDWQRCVHEFGYVSSRPGDSTIVVVRMDNPCLGNKNDVSGLFVCFSPTVLPKEYRPYLKRFVPSMGIHAGVVTQSGLKLGMTPAEVEVVLGKAVWKEKDAYYYAALADALFSPEFLSTRWHWPKNVESKPGGDERIITVWFVGGRVSCFEVRKLYDL